MEGKEAEGRDERRKEAGNERGRQKYIYECIHLVNGVRQGSASHGSLVWDHIQTMGCFLFCACAPAHTTPS